MDVRRIGLVAVAAGAGAQVGGLALDAWLHAADQVGQDGVLSLENLGHALFVGGLVAVVAGAVLALVGPRLYRPRPEILEGRWRFPEAHPVAQADSWQEREAALH